MTDKQNVTTRGRTFTGTVIAAKMPLTATIQWERRKFVPKYERYEKRRTRIKAHNPENINAVEGDVVVVQECRRLSKTKNFIILSKVKP
jgi:small subunit ribosomal protein S17